ncbi:MAG: DUF1295 domain-containing protein [bacterium]|nr:DUF1295 domain-containing protein [bacterium]
MVLWVSAAAIAGLMAAMWAIGVAMRSPNMVEILWGVLWGFGFAVVAWVSMLVTDGHGVRAVLLAAMATAWGLRLSVYLAFRNLGAGRSNSMRQRSGDGSRFSGLTWEFALQGAAMWVVSLPLQLGVGEAGRGWVPLWVVGAAVFVVGFGFEAVGDWQLARFKADPASAGQVMDRGLWRYTRHPNYFGDAVAWWGIGLVAASTPIGAIGLIGPAFNHWTLLKVSGVPALEGNLKSSRPGYADYIGQTSPFIPRRPKAL